MASTYRFTLIQRLLHWFIALMVFGLLAIGFTLWGLGGYQGVVDTFGSDVTNDLYKYHKTFGVMLLALMVLRVVLRRVSPPPAYEQPLPGPVKVIAGGAHILLYVLLIGMPIGGWIATAAGGFPVQFFDWNLPGLIGKNEDLSAQMFEFHLYGGIALTVLLVLHIGAGIRHWKKQDGVMRRISLP
jgi:cytochrome b561